MLFKEFIIGIEFTCGIHRWRCTDKGQRVIAAICISCYDDEDSFNGPPYSIAELVFDEYDFPGCEVYNK